MGIIGDIIKKHGLKPGDTMFNKAGFEIENSCVIDNTCIIYRDHDQRVRLQRENVLTNETIDISLSPCAFDALQAAKI